MTVTVEVMSYTALAYFDYVGFCNIPYFYSKVTPTNDIDYSCHIKALEIA